MKERLARRCGFFLNWVKLANPALSLSLHEAATYKPFTVSSLFDLDEPNPNKLVASNKAGDLILHPTKLYWFRITSLETSLSQFLLETLAGPKCPPMPPVLGREFELAYITTDPIKHPWAATETYAHLLSLVASSQVNRPVSSRATKVKLLFVSPTTFKSNGRSLALPLPLQTFFSLANRWNTFSGHLIEPGFGEWLEENVSISSYELKSESVWLEGSASGPKLIGFRGWCEYISFSPDEDYNYVLDLLTRFAFFAGVGYKTTWGFGQVIASG